MYSDRQRPDLQRFILSSLSREGCMAQYTPEVYGIVFICNNLDGKVRFVIGVREN